MYPIYKLLALIFCAAFEGILNPTKEQPKAPKEDDAETKWRKWRIARDDELEERRKNKDKGQ